MSDIVNNDTNVERDDTMDISSLIKKADVAASVTTDASKVSIVEEHKTPLQKLKEERETRGLGMVVDNDSLTNEDDKKLIVNKSETDAVNEIDTYNTEMDKLIDASKKVNIVKPPQNPIEMVAMVENLADVSEGKEIAEIENAPQMLTKKGESEDEAPTMTEVTDEIKSSDEETVSAEMSPEKKEIVELIIDKTGYGVNLDLSDDEKDKIVSATELRVTEVEEVNLGSIKVKKADKSFLDTVDTFESSASSVPVVFPASRFRAYMTGLSYGEMGDIALNPENITADQIHKKLSVIYNKMRNPSIGKFTDYEDFLKKFAYIDIDLAVYGLVVATLPEIDELNMTCHAPHCKKGFYHKFSPRSLIQWDMSSDQCLKTFKDVVNCPASDANTLMESSPIHVHKRYKLPFSNFIIEVGMASCYDYLYDILPNVIGDTFKENHPDDVNNILQINNILLSLIRAVYVPDGDEYIEYRNNEDIIQALYHIKPEEIRILSSMLQAYNTTYAVNFELRNVVCPHCGAKTKKIPVSVDDLLFFKYQKLMSTSVDVNNISVL